MGRRDADISNHIQKEKSRNIVWTITVQQDSSDTVTIEFLVTLNFSKESLNEEIRTEDKLRGWRRKLP